MALICTKLTAQTLQRKAFLGAQLMELSVVEESLGTDFGVYLPLILPEGSFGKMNIPEGSVLQQINKTSTESISDVLSTLSLIKEGDTLEVLIYKDGNQETFIGKALGKPREKNQYAVVEYGVVKYNGNKLRSLLYLPQGLEQPPVVFFLQGYTCQSIEMQNDNPAKQLIDNWIKNGYAVFLVEKPGMGDSESDIPCMELDFNQERKAFSEAYMALRNNSSIDNKNIFLFGHSMGGIIAPLLANEHSPAGVMVYGIVGKNWYDYMKDIYTEQPLLFGTSKKEIEEDNQYNLPFIKDLLIHKKNNQELIESPLYGDFLKQDGTAENLAQGYFIQRHYTYWQSLSDVNVPYTWSKVKSPVLVLHGEYDIQAIAPKYGKMIAENVNTHGGKANFELFPKTEHAFLKFNSREELNTVMNNGSYVNTFETNFNVAIADMSLQWMKQYRNH
jgi:hypothetical protein